MLPPEILLNVFSLVPQMHSSVNLIIIDAACGPMRIRNVWELAPITQVCHHWRRVSLHASSLWSSAFCLRRSGGRKYLGETYPFYRHRRGGPLRLYVEAHGVSGHAGDRWQDHTSPALSSDEKGLVDELHVYLDGRWPTSTETLPPCLNAPMLAVQRLVIHAMCSPGRLPWIGSRPLFGNHPLEALKSLAFINTPFLPSNCISSSLTRLVLMHYRQAASLPLPDLLSFLSGTPALEQAYIHGVHLSIPSGNVNIKTVALHRLRKLSVSLHNFSALQVSPLTLLGHLIIEPTCLLRVELDSPQHLHSMTSYLNGIPWPADSPNSVHFAYTDNPDPKEPRVSLQAIMRNGGVRIDIPNLAIEDYLEWVPPLQELMDVPMFASARALWMSGSVAPNAFIAAFHALSRVEELYDVTTFGGLVRSLHPRRSSNSATPLAFPQAVVLYTHIFNRGMLRVVRDVLLHRQEGNGIQLLLASYAGNRLMIDHSEHPLVSSTEVETSIGPHVLGAVEVLGDKEKYLQSKYSLRNVLPPECVDEEEVFPEWPSWTEGVFVPYNYIFRV